MQEKFIDGAFVGMVEADQGCAVEWNETGSCVECAIIDLTPIEGKRCSPIGAFAILKRRIPLGAIIGLVFGRKESRGQEQRLLLACVVLVF